MISDVSMVTAPYGDLHFVTTAVSSHLTRGQIIVGSSIFNAIKNQTLALYQKHISQSGFVTNKVPLDFIEKHYEHEVYTSIKGFLFTHIVFNFLLDEVSRRKIIMANLPRLKKVSVSPLKQVIYDFDLSIAAPLQLKEWKHFAFKSPKRKNYKDLDKQVTLFIKRERSLFKKQDPHIIQDGDWVYFQATLLNDNLEEVSPFFSTHFWIKVATHQITAPLSSKLLDQTIGYSFISHELLLEDAFQEHLDKKYTYRITVKLISKGKHLALDAFKTTFKLKSKASIHKKLIEVFSYRNDISQRKSIVEEIFHLFFSKHRFEIPKHIILRRKEEILFSLKQQPDYRVYKTQKDFIPQIEMLAEKQLKEEILMDQIAYNENIDINEKDIQSYLNLFNNERLKEFVYFKPIIDKIEDSANPIYPSVIQQAALREKALNHIIYLLTK